MECSPNSPIVIVRLAKPPVSGASPRSVSLVVLPLASLVVSKKSTRPVGVPPPGAVTWAVRVTTWPKAGEGTDELAAVVVAVRTAIRSR